MKSIAGGKASMASGQRGRPRDPDFEDRVFDAAVSLYGREGLDGVTIGAIARQARVGKASIYLRWPTCNALLNDALRARIVLETDVDTGDLRADLRRLAEQMLAIFWTDAGLAYIRRIVDRTIQPERFDAPRSGENPTVIAARRLVRNAIKRGELSEDASPTILMDMLFGSTMMHALVLPIGLRGRAKAQAPRYLDELVEAILTAVGAAAARA
jgi:AcrR family transcriptional regulator